MIPRINVEFEEAESAANAVKAKDAWELQTHLSCPFCGTQPRAAQFQGVWCNNDDCPIVGTVFSGGADHWNHRAANKRIAELEQVSAADAKDAANTTTALVRAAYVAAAMKYGYADKGTVEQQFNEYLAAMAKGVQS